MLVVISSPLNIKDESKIINEMFELGLSLFHLRKPENNIQDITFLLDNINPKFYNRIALHQYHSLVNEYNILRLHYTSNNREEWGGADNKLYRYSKSIHSIEEYNNLPKHTFDYCFLSPVYNSISKPYYSAKPFDLGKKDKNQTTKIIALGGITAKNCNEPKKMNFDGIALLGSIWNENPIQSFIKIKQCYEI